MGMIFAIVLGPLVISMIFPRVWLLPYGILVLFGIAYILFEQSRQCAGCGSAGSAIGLAIIVFAITGFILGMAIRGVIALYKPVPRQSDWSSRFASLVTWALISAAVAMAATGLSVILLNKMFDSGWGTHLGISLLALAWFFWIPAIWRKGGGTESAWYSLLHPGGVVRWSGAIAMLFLLAWSVLTIPAVGDAAELAAAGRPYCLTTSTEKGLRPAQTLWDLSGFSMQADRGSLRHAALVAGDVRAPDWFYWSYRHGAFDPESLGWPVTCELQPGFAKNLPAMPPVQAVDSGASFWLARGQWHIPAGYRGDAGGRPPVMIFHAKGEDFGPLPMRTGKPVYDIEMMHSEVRVTLCDLEMLHVWQAQNDINHKVEPAGMEAGLEKQSVEPRRWPGKEFQYIGRDKTGRISTWLLCHEGGDICRHAFRREGMVVEFQYSRSHFAQWREMQDLAWKRFKSFAVVWPDAGSQSCKS